jgi:predicted homoserine dehydrogenase-like protein
MIAPPIPHVRIGLIGLGRRGMKTLERYAFIEGATIACIADVDAKKLEEANQKLIDSNRSVAKAFCGIDAW